MFGPQASKALPQIKRQSRKILKSRYTWYPIKALVIRDGGSDINLIELSNQKTQPKQKKKKRKNYCIFLLILSKS